MRTASKVILVLSFLAMSFFLIMPLIERGIAWDEAALAHLIIIVVQIIFGLTFALIPAKDPENPAKGFLGARKLLLFCAIYYLVLGGVVFVGASINYEDNKDAAEMEMIRGYGGGYDSYDPNGYDSYDSSGYYNYNSYGSFNLYEAYAKDDQTGIIIGAMATGIGFLAAIGWLVLTLLRKKYYPVA